MYLDKNTIESLGTARLLSRNALDYEDFLYQKLGRAFVLALPVEHFDANRIRARFVSDEQASGEGDSPYIDLWIEFNPAMGLYTVWGEYWRNDGSTRPGGFRPIYKSSPRSGFDDEMLSDPSRLFDWLDHVASGQPVSYGFSGMMTPAGVIESVLHEKMDGVFVYRLEPEYRMPLDYYVSGTGFPGPKGGELPMGAAKLGPDDWENYYASPVQNAVQSVMDRLYGDGAYEVDVDEEGFVYVTGLQPIPAQNFGSLSPPKGASTMSYPKDTNLNKMESKAWYTDELLRMAGVKGQKLADRTVTPKAAQKGGSIKENKMDRRVNDALESLATQLEAKSKKKMTEMLCEMCGCELAAKEAKKAGDGKMLCEQCWTEAYGMGECAFCDADVLDSDLIENTDSGPVCESCAEALYEGDILATVPSKSDPEKSYQIVMGKDGNVYCTCPAWKYQKGVSPKDRTCKHIKTLYGAMASQAKLTLPKEAEGGKGKGKKSKKESVLPVFGSEDVLVLEADLEDIAELLDEAKPKAKAKLGSGGRFKSLVKALKKRGDVEDPSALAAWIGRKKYGAKKFAKMAAAGREESVEDLDEARALSDIAQEIKADWKNVEYSAKPYLSAMYSLQSVGDSYGADSGASIVAYFLSNASKWRGPKAKEIKAELKKMLK